MPPSRKRPPEEVRTLARLIRSQVYSDKLKRGALLPTLAVMAEQYGVPPRTMQETVRLLTDEGIIVGQGSLRRVRSKQATTTGALLLLLEEAAELLAGVASKGVSEKRAGAREWLARVHEAGVDV